MSGRFVVKEKKNPSYKKPDRVKEREMLYSDLQELFCFGYTVNMHPYDKMRVLRLVMHKVREGEF